MAQLRTAQWLRVWPDQGHTNLSIELKAIQATHQVGEFSVIQWQPKWRGIGLTTTQLQLMAILRRTDRHGNIIRADWLRDAAQDLTGIGEHHREQRLQVIALPLQLGLADQRQGEAGKDADGLGALAGRKIR